MPRRYLSKEEKLAIIERAESLCEYCLTPVEYSAQPFVFEHIIPVSLNGKTTPNNLAFACGGCNGHKYNKIEAIDPVEKISVPLFHPRKQKWLEHFSWDEDYKQVIGLTSVGRVTINTLKLNRIGIVNIRELLCLVGKHPP